MRRIGLIVVGFLFGVLLLTAIDLAKRPATRETTSTPPPPEPVPVTQVEDAPQRESWRYSQDTDQMTGKVTQWACLDSKDQLQFAFPYQGGTRGTICLRKRGESDAYFKIDKGQSVCGAEGCEVLLKVNGGKPFAVRCSESNDGDSRFLFFDSYKLISALAKKTRQIKIEVLYYQEGQQVLTFEPFERLDSKW